jgi:hypothetical protein
MMNGEKLADFIDKAVAFEERWDSKLGGQGTRPYRELLGYVAGRIINSSGAAPADIVEYLREMVEKFGQDGITSRAGAS